MRICIFDTETTDLIANSLISEQHRPRIVEFFGHIVDPRTGEVFRELDTLIHPEMKITETTTRITGITDEMVRDAPKIRDVAGDICSLINDSDAGAAHNMSYDFQVVNFELERAGAADKIRWPSRLICTVEETEWMKGYRLNLNALHEELIGEPFSGAHRARQDVEALTRCVVELFKRGDL